MPSFDLADVRSYYDRHTRTFITFGQGGGAGVIHRAVWGPGVTTREQAFHHVDERIAALIRMLPASRGFPHVVDLGCGVGASLCYLARRTPLRGTGITLSPVQARLAARRIRDAGLDDRVRCIEADYCSIPDTVERAHLAYAIESFVHGPAAETMLAAWARLVRPGGVLVICDDFTRATGSDAARCAVDRFRRGWHVNTLLLQEELQALARAAGFEHLSTVDLSDALEIGRPRDRVIGWISRASDWLPVGTHTLDHLRGGAALQECLERGWIGYDFTVLRRR
jgi:predicted O-methyltransferase YrrM